MLMRTPPRPDFDCHRLAVTYFHLTRRDAGEKRARLAAEEFRKSARHDQSSFFLRARARSNAPRHEYPEITREK